jgi:DNA-binding GntR family transcriptional regulator
MVGEAVVPATLFPCLPERREAAVNVVTLAQAAGILLGKGEDRISMRPAPEDVAEVLGVAHGTLVMYLERLVFALDGPALEWSTGYCHAPGCYYLAELS